MPTRLLGFSTVFLAVALSGCPIDAPGSDGGPPGDTYASAAACPDGSTLTYDTFGQNFFETYCVLCHSEANVGPVRNGAPADVNFDSIELVRPLSRRIDFMAAIGPARAGRFMPPRPGDLRPSDEERMMLGEWLACGAP